MALSFVVYAKKRPVKLDLRESGILIQSHDKTRSIAWSDVLGARELSCDIPCFALLSFCTKGKIRVFQVNPSQRDVYASASSQECVSLIQSTVISAPQGDSRPTPRRHFTVLINPFSGRKLAWDNWDSVKHFFEACELDVHETQHAGHAGEIAEKAAKGDTILVVSGDGLVHEVINALCRVGLNDSVAIAVIPGGTSNALAYELCMEASEPFSCESSAFIAVTGGRRACDLTRLELTESRQVVYSFMLFAWAIIADIDINSEV
jgi:hypothetical protein